MYLLASFIPQNLKNIFRADPDGPFVMNKIFLVQTIIITFIYLLALFNVLNFKKFLLRIQSCEDVPFLGPKWSICPKFFFWKIINIILMYLLAHFDFLKKSKNHVFGLFLTNFGHFCPMGIFSKKSGCHTQLYMTP